MVDFLRCEHRSDRYVRHLLASRPSYITHFRYRMGSIAVAVTVCIFFSGRIWALFDPRVVLFSQGQPCIRRSYYHDWKMYVIFCVIGQ